MDEAEYETAKKQIEFARTRSEIDAAFHGLRSASHTAAVKTASKVIKRTADGTTGVVSEGGRRAGRAFQRWAYSFGALLIGIILAIAGVGILALVCIILSVLLFVSAMIVPTKSAKR